MSLWDASSLLQVCEPHLLPNACGQRYTNLSLSQYHVLLMLLEDVLMHIVAPNSTDRDNRRLSRCLSGDWRENRVTEFALQWNIAAWLILRTAVGRHILELVLVSAFSVPCHCGFCKHGDRDGALWSSGMPTKAAWKYVANLVDSHKRKVQNSIKEMYWFFQSDLWRVTQCMQDVLTNVIPHVEDA